MRPITLAAIVGALLILSAAEVPFAFALIVPVNVNTSSQAQAIDYPSSRLLCYSNGYYYAFETQSSTNLVYQSSQTGSVWSGVSAAITTSLPSAGSAGIYCDTSGNVFAVWGISATQFQFRMGTTSGGTVTWSFAAITMTCNNGGLICGNVPSIYAFSTQDVWVAMDVETGGGVRYGELWDCQVTCSSAVNWAANLDDSSAKCPQGCMILPLASSTNIAYIAGHGPSDIINIRTTSNGGVSWGTAVATTDANGYGFRNGNCVSVASTVYCAEFDGLFKAMNFLTFTQGGSAWTETAIVTFGSATPAWSTISTDGTNMLVFYSAPTTTTIDYQNSTNLGTSWSGDAAWTNGEVTAVSLISSTPTMQSTVAGVMWQIATSNNIRFGSSISFLLTSIVIKACNFNQLQCWWYPMLFYGVYAGGFMLVGVKGQVGGKGMTYLLLAAMTICSLIQVQMGMMNLLMPVGLTLASIIYAVRSG